MADKKSEVLVSARNADTQLRAEIEAVTRLRDRKMTFKVIAADLGMSVYRARKLYYDGRRRQLQAANRAKAREKALARAGGLNDVIKPENLPADIPAAFLLPVEELNLSVFLDNFFKNSGVTRVPSPRVGDIAVIDVKELLKGPGFGKKSLRALDDIMQEVGLAVGMVEQAEEWDSIRRAITLAASARKG